MSWKKHEKPEGFYVYELVDPANGLPFYVGKGKGNRAFSHLREAIGSTKQSEKLTRIRNIIASGSAYTVHIVKDGISEEIACSLEVELITKYGRSIYDSTGILTNILVDIRQADFSKVIYRKGLDHHSFGKKRTSDSIEKQKQTAREKSSALRRFDCLCGCGVEITGWRKNQSHSIRSKYGFAEYHFERAKNNYERKTIMNTLRGSTL